MLKQLKRFRDFLSWAYTELSEGSYRVLEWFESKVSVRKPTGCLWISGVILLCVIVAAVITWDILRRMA